MDVSLLFPSQFIKSAEFKGRDVTVTITGVKLEELEGTKGVQTKGIVSIAGTKKRWVLNRTNAEAIKAMFGRETDRWIGKRVTLWPAPHTDSVTGELGTAIRVRGSPDIDRDIEFTLALPRKKAVQVKLKRTGQQAKPAPKPAAPAQPAMSEPPDDVALPGEAAFDESTL